jgi:hypothetical protein
MKNFVSLLALASSVGLLAGWPAGAQRSDGPAGRAVNWDRARAEVARYRTVTDNSGLVDVDAQVSTRVDAEDLEALCLARREAVTQARRLAEDALRSLPVGRDPVTDEQRAALERRLGAVASFTGDMKLALRHFEAGRDALTPYVKDYADLRMRWLSLEEAAGVASLRQGEIDNCLVAPNADRCLFPLRPGGRHHHPAGAQAAMAHFASYLERAPDDLQVRWLLNLSAMVLGRHPDAVPRAQRFSADLFRGDAQLPRFLDVAMQAGLGRRDLAGGTIADDFDNDGLLDIVFTSVDYCAPVRFYRNRGNGTFEDRTEAAGLARQFGGLNATQTDYDNDGDLDIFVHRGGWEIHMRNSLLRNDGHGAFTDVTREAGLSSGAHSTHSAAWADYDNDGWLDVFVGHELTPSQLFRNRGNGTFEDVTARAGVGATAFSKGVSAGDFDRDGFPDLYVSNMFGNNFLYRNNGDGTFTDVAGRAGVQKPFVSFSTWFFDYDNDGWLDIFVSSYPNSVEEFVKHYLKIPPVAETLTLYRNNGNGTFTDVSEKVGLARVVPTMGANFGDLDNDGFLDMYLGTGAPSFAALMPNIMLRSESGRRFVDVTDATGTGHLQKGHGIAFADVDTDGDEDVVLNVGGAVPGDSYEDALFRNPGGYGHNWTAIRLVGVKSNRAGVGARLTLTLRGVARDSALRMREVTSGGSFGANSFMQHVGLGRATSIECLEIFWPASGTRQVLRNVPINRPLVIREGDDSLDTPSAPEPGRGPG